MTNEQIFNQSNKLKSFSVAIDDLELVQEVVISLEISYKNSSPVINGKLLINDIYDLHTQVEWKDSIVKIVYIDLLENINEKSFRVTNIQELEHSNYKKALEISIQDTFSYSLQHSFLSKGFTGTITSALNEYVNELGLSDYSTDFSETKTSESFVVPKHISNLEFFINEFENEGCYFYQDRNSVYVKSVNDIFVSNLPVNDGIFINETDNKFYKNRIIASRVNINDRDSILPKIRSFTYDFDSKSINYDSNNEKTDFLLNENEENIQDDLGFYDVYQQRQNFDKHTKTLRDSFLSQNQIEMVVNGFHKNTVNQIYDVKLRGNVVSPETHSRGNQFASGKYVCFEIVDKIIGDSFIQKIYLHRADSQKRV